MRRHDDPWKNVLAGLVGGAVGTLVMSAYWNGLRLAGASRVKQAENPEPGPLGDISVVPKQLERGEKSHEAVGRILYTTMSGHKPESKETKTLLGELVHWVYGTVQGAVYAVLRGRARVPDLAGGALLGGGLWIVSALGLPVGGLSKGPTAFPASRHAAEGIAHLVYGVSAAAVTQVLLR